MPQQTQSIAFVVRSLAACRSLSLDAPGSAGAMTAVPSREVTTSQVSAVTFGFYTEKEVLLRGRARRASA